MRVTRLPYRRFLGGYRREAVHALLRELEDRIRRLEHALELANSNSGDLAAQLKQVEAELAEARGRELEVTDLLTTAQRRALELEQAAQARADAILSSAWEQAARVRDEAEREIARERRTLDDLLRLRQETLESFRRSLGHVAETLERVERGDAPVLEAADEGPPVEDAPETTPPPPIVKAGDEAIFEQLVQLEAGPFSDFAALSSFERELARIPQVDDVYVRRFGDERALIEVGLREPAPLVAAMRRVVSFPFDVDDRENGTVRITLATAQLAGSD